MRRWIFPALLAAMIVVVLAMPAPAGDCRRVNLQSYQTYVAPVTYSNQAYNYATYEPVVIKYVVPLASYTSVGDNYRDAYFAREVANELYRLIEAGKPNLGPAPSPMPAGAESLKAPQSKSGKTKIATILADNCVSCHSGKQAPNLAGDPEAIPELVRLRSFLAVSSGQMPKGKDPLGNDDLNELARWAKAGTHEKPKADPAAKK